MKIPSLYLIFLLQLPLLTLVVFDEASSVSSLLLTQRRLHSVKVGVTFETCDGAGAEEERQTAQQSHPAQH